MGHLGHDAADYLNERLPPERMTKAHAHLASCGECRLLLARERHLQSLLHAVNDPCPSSAFTARLLQHTGSLAARQPEPAPQPARRSGSRKAAAAAGAVAAVAAVLGAGAYAAGAAAGPAARTQQLSAVSASWPRSPGQPPEAISQAALDRLHAAGWGCPELSSLGFRLVAARGYEQAGLPTLQLQLTDAASATAVHTVTIFEQHGSTNPVPMNALTGHPVTADGFLPDPEDAAAGGQLWLLPGRTWQAVYRNERATYTVKADLPPGQVRAAVTKLAAANSSAPAAGASDDVVSRVLRGLQRLALWSGS